MFDYKSSGSCQVHINYRPSILWLSFPYKVCEKKGKGKGTSL